MNPLRILTITDIHYVRRATWNPDYEPRECGHMLEWFVRALKDACWDGAPDVIALLGDFVQDGNQPGSEYDLQDLAAAVRDTGIPTICVPGNHDENAQKVLDIFGDKPGLHKVKGYHLYSFVDSYAPGDFCTRSPDDLAAFRKAAGKKPIITLQHNPVFPDIDHEYPYLPVNVADIRNAYEEAKVVLSLSGHYHEGQELTAHNGVHYHTVPALNTAPYRFELIAVQDRDVSVEPRQLQMPEGASIVDVHTHTHFGYCAETVHPARSFEQVASLGLKGVACVEHAGQVYLPPEIYWGTAHVNTPGIIEEKRNTPDNRMPAYKKVMAEFHKQGALVGLEVECDVEGNITLLDEDKDGWDIILGGLHWIPNKFPTKREVDFKQSFMRCTEDLVNVGIDILAHPFRIFGGNNRPAPKDLYYPLAEMLKANNIAAEVNSHHRPPDPEFFRICAEVGVRIVMGSDAHKMEEVGWLYPNLRILKQAGLGVEDLWDCAELFARRNAQG
jgi:histidinol phosphatase-like PHP family hydrolase/calcineurin-like phosphoesterase family protein